MSNTIFINLDSKQVRDSREQLESDFTAGEAITYQTVISDPTATVLAMSQRCLRNDAVEAHAKSILALTEL